MNVADRDILIATYHASVPKLILGDRRHLSALTPEYPSLSPPFFGRLSAVSTTPLSGPTSIVEGGLLYPLE